MFRYSLTVKSLGFIRVHSYSKSRLASTQNQSLTREQIFYNLINHHNRKRSIPTDLLSRAIENIHPKISERLSLLILSSAARLVHNATFEKRLELLHKVRSIFSKGNREEFRFIRKFSRLRFGEL